MIMNDDISVEDAMYLQGYTDAMACDRPLSWEENKGWDETYKSGYADGSGDRERKERAERQAVIKYAWDSYLAGHITQNELRQYADNVLNGTVTG